MVVCYSRTGETLRCAKALAEIKGETLFELKTGKKTGMFMGVLKSIAGGQQRVDKLPDMSGESTVYICSPVWAGRFAPAARYFIKHCDFNGKTVKLLLTCMTPSDDYVSACEKELLKYGIKLSGSHVVATKENPDIDTQALSSL